MENNLIALKQLPIIEEQLQSVRAAVEKRTEIAQSVVCTEETYKDIKKLRADLTKEFNEFETQRKDIKTKIMEPYNEFDKTYKKCVADPYVRADITLREKITQVENGIKADKERQVREYYEELCQVHGIDWIPWEQRNVKINMSTSVKQMKAGAEQYVNMIVDGMTAISTMEDSAEIMVEYKKCLDVSQAVRIVSDRHKALEDVRRAEENRKAMEEARKAHEANVKAAVEARKELLDPPKAEEPPVYSMRFSVNGTLEQLKKLKNFMIQEGINFESI